MEILSRWGWRHEKFCKYTRQTGVSLEPSLDLTLSKSKLDIARAYSYEQSSVSQKNSIALSVINQSAIRGLKRRLLAGLDGGMAYECLDACDCGNLQLDWIVYHLASSSNWLQSAWIVYRWMYVIKLVMISLDRVSMDVDSGFDDRLDGGSHGWFNSRFDSQFNLAVLGYQPQQSVWKLIPEAKRTRCFTNLFYRLC